MKLWKIIDQTTRDTVCHIWAKTERGAKLSFRRRFAAEFRYPHISAIEVVL